MTIIRTPEQIMIISPAVTAFRIAFRYLPALMALLWMGAAPAISETAFARGPTQYIAALGDPAATSGTDAQTWGFWSVDPGPRGVWISDYQDLMGNAGVAPDGWRFDPAAWWQA